MRCKHIWWLKVLLKGMLLGWERTLLQVFAKDMLVLFVFVRIYMT